MEEREKVKGGRGEETEGFKRDEGGYGPPEEPTKHVFSPFCSTHFSADGAPTVAAQSDGGERHQAIKQREQLLPIASNLLLQLLVEWDR